MSSRPAFLLSSVQEVASLVSCLRWRAVHTVTKMASGDGAEKKCHASACSRSTKRKVVPSYPMNKTISTEHMLRAYLTSSRGQALFSYLGLEVLK